MSKVIDRIISKDFINKPDGRKFHGPDKYKQMAEWAFDHNPQVAARIHASLASKSAAPVSYAQAKASFATHFEGRMKNIQVWSKKLGTKPDSAGEVLKQAIRGQGYMGEVATANWMRGFEAGLGKSEHIVGTSGKLLGRTATDPTYIAFRNATGWKGSVDDYNRLVWRGATDEYEYTDIKGNVWIFEIKLIRINKKSIVVSNYRKK